MPINKGLSDDKGTKKGSCWDKKREIIGTKKGS